MSGGGNGGGRFRIDVPDFNSTYKGLDTTYDLLDQRTKAVVTKTSGVSPTEAGGEILGVVEGLQAGKVRAHGTESGTMRHALGALRNRTGHLMNGMYESLQAYHEADELHADAYGKIEGQGPDPAAGDMRARAPESSTPAPRDPSKLPQYPPSPSSSQPSPTPSQPSPTPSQPSPTPSQPSPTPSQPSPTPSPSPSPTPSPSPGPAPKGDGG